MGFRDELRQFTETVKTREQAVFTGVVDECHRSIVEGSELTGAPGQPVDTGNLKASWQKTYETESSATIATNVGYTPFIEDGGNSRGEFRLRSEVGGFHSLALTIAGFDRIVDTVTAQAHGGAPLDGSGGWSGEDGG